MDKRMDIGEKAERKLAEARSLFDSGDHSESLPHFLRGAKLFARQGDKHKEAICRRSAADALVQMGRYEECIPYLRLAAGCLTEEGDRHTRAAAFGAAADAAFRLHRYEECVPDALLAAQLFSSIGVQHGEALALQTAGNALLFSNKYEECLPHLFGAIDLFSGVGDRDGEARSSLGAAQALGQLGRLEESASLFLRSAELFAMAEEHAGEADALGRCAAVLFKLDHDEEASAYALRAAGLFATAGDRHSEAQALQTAGNAFFATGNYEESKRHSLRAAELFSQAGDHWGEARSREVAGGALSQIGREEDGVRQFSLAAELFSEVGDSDSAAEVTCRAALVLRKMDRGEESASQFLRAAELYEKGGNSASAGSALVDAAKALPGAERYEEAWSYCVRAARLFAEAGDQQGEANALRHAGLYKMLRRQYVESLEFTSRSADLCRGVGDKEGEARSLLGVARALSRIDGRVEESVPHFRRAAKLFVQVGDYEARTAVLLDMAEAMITIGRHEDCIRHASRAAARLSASDDRDSKGRSDLLVARALIRLGRYGDSVSRLEAAKELLFGVDAVGYHEATLLLLAAERLIQRGAPPAEIGAAYAEGVERFRKGDMLFLHGGKFYPLSYDLTDCEGSIPHLLRAADLFGKAGEPEAEANARLEAARALLILERYDDSASQYLRAAGLSAALDDFEGEAGALDGAACALRSSDRSAESVSLALRAADLFARAQDATGEAAALLGVALGLSWSGHDDESVAYSLQAATRSAAADDRHGEAKALLWAARALAGRRHLQECVPHFCRAAELFTEEEDHEGETQSRFGLAVALAGIAIFDPTPATISSFIGATERALDVYELSRRRLRFQWQRQSFQRVRVSWLETLSRAALFFRLDDLLWRLEQAIKGRTFLEESPASTRFWHRFLENHTELKDAVRVYEILRLDYERLGSGHFLRESLLTRRLTNQEDRRVRVDETRSRLAAAEKRIDRLLYTIALRSPQAAAMARVEPASLAGFRRHLRKGEVYVGFLWLDRAVVRLLVTPDEGLKISAASGEEFERIRTWLGKARRRNLSHGDWLTLSNHRVVSALLGDIPDGTRTLLISPYGPLVGIPFHCMGTPGDRRAVLGERYAIAIVPAAGILLRARRSKRHAAELPYTGVACNADGRIPGVDKEVSNVWGRYFQEPPPPGVRFVTEDVPGFFSLRTSTRTLHFACHAGAAGLRLREGEGSWVTPSELLNLDLEAHVLVCTGCSVGRFSPEESNEFLGVVRQLLAVTGARAAVVSVQPVPDAAGVVFADLLFAGLTGREPVCGWGRRVPGKPLSVGEAVDWARWRMGELTVPEIEPLVGGLPVRGQRLRDATEEGKEAHLDPRHASWRDPWFLVGDPAVRLYGGRRDR